MNFRKKLPSIILVIALTAFAACENPTTDDPNILVSPERPSIIEGKGQLNVRWTRVAGAIGYKVYVAGSENAPEASRRDWVAETDDVLIVNETKLVQIYLTGLQNNVRRYVWVKAVYEYGTSDYSEVAEGMPIFPPAPRYRDRLPRRLPLP